MIAARHFLPVLAIFLLGTGAGESQVPSRVTVRLTVTDAATNEPIAAVSVRLLDSKGAVIATGITDADGLFVYQMAARPEIQFEFEKVGHVRRPERKRVAAMNSLVSLDGRLLRTDQTAEYYEAAASEADRMARTMVTTAERESVFKDEWGRAAALDSEHRALFATSLSDAGKSALAADASFAAAQGSGKSKFVPEMRANNTDVARRRLVYEVVLNEDQGNFTFNKSELPDEAKQRLDQLISALKADPKGVYFEIEGHTDNVGDPLVNEKIGLERAEAVKRYLYEQHQVPLYKINVISYGEDKPVASNRTRDGRAQNRRVIVKVLN